MKKFALGLALLALGAVGGTGAANASVTFSVSGTFSDGGALSGTFTTDDTLTGLESTALTVSGGSLGLDSVIFNELSYIAAGTVSLPNSFSLLAPSSVTKGLSLFFAAPLTADGALLTSASANFQDGAGTRHITVGSVTGPGVPIVPEPASWALMIGGFALAGGAMRRKGAVRILAA